MNKEHKQILDNVNKGLRKLEFPNNPKNLYDAIKYILKLEGKRIRPMLALLVYRLYNEDYNKVILPILALEVFHNFTLIHDDIMDDAPLRRGNQAIHVKWDRNIAILSGDVMMIKAYELLCFCPNKILPKLLKDFNYCAKEVCEGQQKDMDFEKLPFITVNQYLDMISQKTATLLGASFQMGAVLAGTSLEESDELYHIGMNLGIAFQLQDDLLDLYGGESFGKQIGGDIINKKKSILITKALELTENNKKELIRIYNAPISQQPDKVKIIAGIFNKLHIQSNIKSMIAVYKQRCYQKIEQLKSPRANQLLAYIRLFILEN